MCRRYDRFMFRTRTTVRLMALATMMVLLTACAAGTDSFSDQRAGFLFGVWHGWIAPVAIIWHFLFDDSVRIYETNNTGIWYDVGFYMAIISGFGSLSLSRRTRRAH